MKIKKGDSVIVIAGKDRGTTGKVLKALPKRLLIIVEGVNIRKKHTKKRQGTTKGEVIEKTMPLHVSNVAIVDPTTGKAARVGKKLIGDRYIRVSKKSGKEL